MGRHLLIAAILVNVAACARSSSPGAPQQPPLRDVSRAWNHAADSRNADAMAEFFAPNIVVMSPQGRAPVRGIADNRAAWARFFRGGNPVHTMTTDSVVVARGNDLGYVTGRWTVGVDTPNGRAEAAGDYLAVWQRLASGWKLVAVSAYPFR
jgi:ketosteroid isomerase-like protein